MSVYVRMVAPVSVQKPKIGKKKPVSRRQTKRKGKPVPRPLTLRLIDLDSPVIKETLNRSGTWRQKMLTQRELCSEQARRLRQLERISPPVSQTELDDAEMLLDEMLAAQRICTNQYFLNREPSCGAFQESAKWLPYAHCRLFRLHRHVDGQIRAETCGALSKIESALKLNEDPAKDRKLTDAFEYFFRLAALVALPVPYSEIDPDDCARMVSTKIVPVFCHLMDVPPQWRDHELKRLRKEVMRSFDLAATRQPQSPHGNADVFRWKDEDGKECHGTAALAAIHHAKLLIAEKQQIPTKGELSKFIGTKIEQLRDKGEQFWTTVWDKAGLNELPKATPWEIANSEAQILIHKKRRK